MTTSSDEPDETGDATEPGYIDDSQLPEDLRPDEEENPLAVNEDEQSTDDAPSDSDPSTG